MHINPISTCYDNQVSKIGNKPVFKAVLLKDNVTLTDKNSGQTINAAIVESETETRELIADARYRARQKMSDEEFDKIYTDKLFSFMDKYYALDSITDYDKDFYMGDYKFMGELANKDKFRYAKQINERVQSAELFFNNELNESNASSIGKYWYNYTNGKMDIVPSKNYGLSDKKLEGYIKAGYPWNLSPIDSIIPKHSNSSKRQRIILAVDSQKDKNYRNLKPDTNVYGIAEIYTERAMDAVEDYCSQNKGITQKTPEQLGKEALEFFGLKGSKIEPVNVFLTETLNNIKGAGKALLEAACDKGKYCGIFVDTSETMSHGFFLKNGFNYISGWKENKLFKPGFLKSAIH